MNIIDFCFGFMAFSSFLITYISYNESLKGHYFNVVFSLVVNVIIWLTYLALIKFVGEVNLENLARRFNIGNIIQRLVGGNYCYFFNMPEPSEPESDMAYSSLNSSEADGHREEVEIMDLMDNDVDDDLNNQLQNMISNERHLRNRFADGLRENLNHLRNIADPIPEEEFEGSGSGAGSRAGSRSGSRSRPGSALGSRSGSGSGSGSSTASSAPPEEHYIEELMETTSSSRTESDAEM